MPRPLRRMGRRTPQVQHALVFHQQLLVDSREAFRVDRYQLEVGRVVKMPGLDSGFDGLQPRRYYVRGLLVPP